LSYERKSESESENKNDDTETKMAVFNYETAIKLPVLYETGPVEIRDFLNNVEAYYDFLDNASKISLIAFVIKTKIQGTPKTKIGKKQRKHSLDSVLRQSTASILGKWRSSTLS
jgi:hypothetical protein